MGERATMTEKEKELSAELAAVGNDTGRSTTDAASGKGFVGNEDLCADCEHRESDHGDGACRVEQCGCLEFSDKPFTCYHCKAGQCAQCVGAACHCDCLDYEQPRPAPTIWALWMPFKKTGFPSLGTFGKTERKVVIIPMETWNALCAEIPALQTKQFNVGSYE